MLKKKAVVVLGRPGSGKGAQCRRLAAELPCLHVPVGELLRREKQRPGSNYAKLIEAFQRTGNPVPVLLVCTLVENFLVRAPSSPAELLLLDGFPMDLENLHGWTSEMGDQVEILLAIYLDCPLELCKERCLSRAEDRSDDRPATLQARLGSYVSRTQLVLRHFQRLGLLRRVDASRSIDQVYDQIKGILVSELLEREK